MKKIIAITISVIAFVVSFTASSITYGSYRIIQTSLSLAIAVLTYELISEFIINNDRHGYD